MRTHRPTSVRHRSPVAVATAILAGLLSGTVPGSALLAQTVSIELGLDAERVEALFAGSGSVSAADLLSEALTLNTGDAPVGDVLLVMYHLRDGQTVGEFRSDPFEAADGPVGAHGILPGADFYGGLDVERDGISGTMAASPAGAGIVDPVRFVARNALGGPSDGFSREVIYAIAVPADPALQAEAWASGLVLFGDETITLESAGGGAGRGEPADAREVLERFAASEQRCRGGVTDYTVYQRTPEKMVIPLYFNAYQGGPECRAVPITEYMDSLHVHAGMGPQRWPAEMAMGYDLLGQGLEDGLAQEGIPLPVSMLTDPLADFSRAAAEVEPGELMVDDVEDRVADRNEFYRRAHLVGKQGINGRPAYHVRAEGMDHFLETTGGTSWSLTAASAWIDAERDVLLRLRLEVVAQGGDANGREIMIESIHLNHRLVPGAPYEMWFPTRHVMRITGLTETMSEEDRQKIAQARAEVEKLRAQMDQIPPAMRGMLEKQIARLEKMSGDGEGPSETEAVIDILRVAVNEGPPYPGGIGLFSIDGARFPGLAGAAWEMAPEYFGADASLYLPTEIGMMGKRGLADAEVTVKITDLQPNTSLEPGPYGSILITGEGTIEGSYRMGDESFQFSPEPGVIGITGVTPTEVRGIFESESMGGSFHVGHMPCSPEPRTVGMNVSDLDVSSNIERDIKKGQEEARAILEDPQLREQCYGDWWETHPLRTVR